METVGRLYNTGSTDAYLSRVSSLLDSDDATHLADYTYLGASDIVGVDYSGEAAINYNLGSNTGAADPYTGGFDQFDRVILDLWQPDGGGSTLVKLGYTFDLAGNRLTRADAVAQAQSPAQNFDEAYLYDGLYRLIDFQRGQLSGGAIDPSTLNHRQNWQTAPSISSSSSSSSSSGTPASVQLDSLGNWLAFNQDTSGAGFSLTQTRTHNTSNEILSITGGGWTTPSYDNAGNTTGFPQATDPTSGATATYDAWNRMVSVSTGNTYAYDGLNRLVHIGVSGLVNTDLYYSDQWQLLELWASIGGGPSLINQRFAWGLRYVDDLVLRDRSTAGDGTLDERLYSLQDAHWSVVALFDPSAPGIVERHAFDAYGNPFFLNPDFSDGGDSYAWSFLYSGYLWDPSTGLFYIRNRVYHPVLGRWLQRDPIGYDAGDMNLYAYVADAPSNASDPTGKLCCATDNQDKQGGGQRDQQKERGCCLSAVWAGLVPQDVAGGVVCCRGVKYVCAFRNSATRMASPTAKQISRACIVAHERTHLDQIVDCDPKKCVERPNINNKKTTKPEAECAGYKVHVECLNRRLKECAGDANCEKEINAETRYREGQRDYWCNIFGN